MWVWWHNWHTNLFNSSSQKYRIIFSYLYKYICKERTKNIYVSWYDQFKLQSRQWESEIAKLFNSWSNSFCKIINLPILFFNPKKIWKQILLSIHPLAYRYVFVHGIVHWNLSKKGFIYQLSNSLIIYCIFMILSVLQILTILMNHTIDTDIKIL